jgi:hypothetical protein
VSTRGCVAIGTPACWRGVYNHWDSYPTGLGKTVWDHLQALLGSGKTLEQFAGELLRYDDWRAYLRKGICEYCGKRTTQPHSISGVVSLREEKFKSKAAIRRYYRSVPAWRCHDKEIEAAIRREWQIRANVQRTGYPDPRAIYHEHDLRPVKEQQITSDNPDPLFIEWVYVVEPKARTFFVLSHRGQPTPSGNLPVGESPQPVGNGRWDYGHCIYWHELAGSFPIDGSEPNWAKLEAS